MVLGVSTAVEKTDPVRNSSEEDDFNLLEVTLTVTDVYY